MFRRIAILIALVALVAVACDKKTTTREISTIKAAAVTAGSPTAIEVFFVVDLSGAGADQVIVQVKAAAGFVSGLTVSMVGPVSGNLTEIPGNARAYVRDVANIPDGDYNFFVNGSVQADCTVYFNRADAPTSANTVTSPSGGTIFGVGVPVNFTATAGGNGDCFHYWAFQYINTGEIAGIVEDDTTISQSFGSAGNWQAYSWGSGIYRSLGVFNLHVVVDGTNARTNITIQ